jgi:HEAT repeat protein
MRANLGLVGAAGLIVGVSCTPSPPAVAPSPDAVMPVGSTAASLEPAVRPRPVAQPVEETPVLPEDEAGQLVVLDAIKSTCDVVAVLYRHPPDLGSRRCLEQLDDCLPRLHALTLLAQSPFPVVRGKALAAAAVMHNVHDCGGQQPGHPCAQNRFQVDLGDSEACPQLAWLPRALAEALNDPELAVRRGAAEGLVNTVVPAEMLVPSVKEVLRNFEPGPMNEDRRHLVNVVLMALQVAGDRATGLAPELDRLLLERDLHDREVVANVLKVVARLGVVTEALETRVIEALGDRRPHVRLAAVEALGAIGDKDDAKHLVPLLNDRDETVRQVARAMRERLSSPLLRLSPGF